MRVLIIGCGYIGLALGARLVRAGHEVFGLRRSVHRGEDLKAAGINPVACDITNPDQLARLPRDCERVVSCVASGGGDAESYRALYLNGTRNVIEWLSASPPVQFVYTSSTSVFGQNDGSEVDEASPTEPGTDTGRILVETENVILEAARQGRLPASILRLGAIYGPGRGYWLKQFLNGEARIEGQGDRYLNMIHRNDVVGAIVAALDRSQTGEVYNAVDDEPVTQLVFFQWLSNFLGRPMPIAVEAGPESSRKRGVTNKRVSNRKLKEKLGYRFEYPTFREGCMAELRS
jgi:nucleoside-diphosphate-sugar epimerase